MPTHIRIYELAHGTHDVQVGDVVQIEPNEETDWFGGCLMTVTEVKIWGVQGFVAMPVERGQPPAKAYYRVKHGQYARIGQAEWAREEEESNK